MLRFRRWDERGAAPVEMTFAIILLMTLALGVVQVGLTLYARNVLIASAHEGARAALERGRSSSEAAEIVRDVVTRATGRLVDGLNVEVATSQTGTRRVVSVRVNGVVRELGPVPLRVPMSSLATAQMDEVQRR